MHPQPLSLLSLVLSSMGEHSWFWIVKLECLKSHAYCNYPDTIQQNDTFDSEDFQMSRIREILTSARNQVMGLWYTVEQCSRRLHPR